MAGLLLMNSLSFCLSKKVSTSPSLLKDSFFFFFFFFFFFGLFRAVSGAYGSSEARGRIRAIGADLHHSHSNAQSKLHLRPTAQLMATLDP